MGALELSQEAVINTRDCLFPPGSLTPVPMGNSYGTTLSLNFKMDVFTGKCSAPQKHNHHQNFFYLHYDALATSLSLPSYRTKSSCMHEYLRGLYIYNILIRHEIHVVSWYSIPLQ